MPNDPAVLTIRLDSPEAAPIRRALSSEQRVRALSALARRVMTVNDIAAELGIAPPKASVHVRVLEEAGLVVSANVPTTKGSEKRCWAKYAGVHLDIPSEQPEVEETERCFTEEVTMPIGAYTSVSVTAPCGLASDSGFILPYNSPESLPGAQRLVAELMWFTSGWVEYTFPCTVPPEAEITEIDFIAELCSETIGYNNDWPSDITVWINGFEVGTWRCPGDFGGRRGRLNPEWWLDRDTQHGELKSWSVDSLDCRLDGASTTFGHNLSTMGIEPGKPVLVRIGNREDAAHVGGVNIFGKHFGDYPQDLILRYRYTLPPTA